MKRVVSLVSISVLLTGCLMTRSERKIATIGAAGVAVGGIAYSLHGMLSSCDYTSTDKNAPCEEGRDDRTRQGAVVGLIGLAAAIILQLQPVSDPEPEIKPTPRVVVAPPPPPETANRLHSPEAVKLARTAQLFAAEGKCVEVFGTLNALRTIDRPFADQLAAWDPTVSRCRTTRSPTAIEATVDTNGAPATVAPTR